MNSEHSSNIMIVAGEPSGDAHAARLVRSIIDQSGEGKYSFFGAAGPKMRAAGVRPSVYADDLSVVGLLEIARSLPMFMRARRQLIANARDLRPAIAILVDFPEFNLRLARSLKRIGIKVVYYISPQLWAWRGSRIKTVRSSVDKMLTILPFEAQWYAERGYDRSEYVGNPLANEVSAGRSRDEFFEANDLDPERAMIALLPGSREKEVSHIAPILIETADILALTNPALQFVLPVVSTAIQAEVEAMIADRRRATGVDPVFRVIVGETYDALAAADAAAVTSGTATLEAAVLGTPMVIIYKTSRLNAAIFRPMISVEHFGLVNLIAGERVATELIQEDLSPRAVTDELIRLLEPDTNKTVRAKLRDVSKKLGEGGASKRAAAAILKMVS